jgi:hypothetical protein
LNIVKFLLFKDSFQNEFFYNEKYYLCASNVAEQFNKWDMNTVYLNYQISLFGNYDEISPTPETIRIFLDMFSDNGFIPNIQNEISFTLSNTESVKNNPSTKQRLRLSSSNNSWNIGFGQERIDFILTNIDIGVFDMPDFADFIADCKDFIGKINNKYPKRHRRIGVVQNILLSETPEDIQKKFNKNIPAFDNKPLFDWTNRISTREVILSDEINIVSEIRKVKTPLFINSQQTIFDGFLVNVDINTIDENRYYRIGQDNVENYINVIVEKHNEIKRQTFSLINANE